MYRVLIFGMTENPGGVESFLINYYRNIDRSVIQFDFLCNSYEPVAYEEELLALGGKTFHFTARSKSPVKYRRELKKFFREHAKEYDAIWVNVCSLANIDYLKLAKKYGIKRRIIHSHNSQNMDSRIRGLLHKKNRKKIGRYATDFWACSQDAARWFYSTDLLEKAVVIHNAIDVERMSFSEIKREKYRKQLNWDNNFVVGNIGRLHFQKNQIFVLRVFRMLLDRLPEARLVLIGQGEDEFKLKQEAERLQIKEYVYFAGVQSDIAGWLSAMDFFLFPSLFEGLSIVALEAQANGIVVLASEKVIPEELRINDNFKVLNLNAPVEEWTSRILEICRKYFRESPETIRTNFIREGYDIRTEVKKLQQLFLETSYKKLK